MTDDRWAGAGDHPTLTSLSYNFFSLPVTACFLQFYLFIAQELTDYEQFSQITHSKDIVSPPPVNSRIWEKVFQNPKFCSKYFKSNLSLNIIF